MSRAAILEAAGAILREHGHAAVTSRKVAARAGLKSQLVHYYFKTMDELFLALFEQVEQQHFDMLTRALAERSPLHALWRAAIDSKGPRLHKEFVALSTHRAHLRVAIARSAERTRAIWAAVIERALGERGLSPAEHPPLALAILLDGAARVIVSDLGLGIDSGHAEVLALVERHLALLEPAVAAVQAAAAP